LDGRSGERVRILDAFVDAGFNAIDTADSYSRFVPGNVGGESETIIGNWLKLGGGRRDKVLILTKVGSEMGDGQKGAVAPLHRCRGGGVPEAPRDRDDRSLPVASRRSGDVGARDDGDLCRADQARKVRAIGCSNFTAARMQESFAASRAHGLPRYECVQPGYNLYARADYERELEPLCVKEGIGVIPYYALASGF
jgi:aryl-alcohol dehydrogenase-like predicted oxidoreductase